VQSIAARILEIQWRVPCPPADHYGPNPQRKIGSFADARNGPLLPKNRGTEAN
jgi:hypothetical protein